MAVLDGRDGDGRNPGREVDAHMVVGLQRRWADVLKHSEEPEVMGIPRSKVSGSPMVHVVLLCTNPMLAVRL